MIKSINDTQRERKKISKNFIFAGVALILAFVFTLGLIYGMMPVGKGVVLEKTVLIKRGFSVKEIAGTLKQENLIRSETIFEVIAFLRGARTDLKPGLYKLDSGYSAYALVEALAAGGEEEVSVLIPEGVTLKEIDKILSQNGIIAPSELIEYQNANYLKLEGFLFPDTYRFHIDSGPEEIVQKFLANFHRKTSLLLNPKSERGLQALILASVLEKEVISYEERRTVAGILQKRLRSGWPLQVDATICYIKQGPCHPITPLDLKIDSPYNTYKYKGLPPTPISNPGLESIKAAINPQDSSYWFYLSNPKTGKTVFSESLEEHSFNKSLYLR